MKRVSKRRIAIIAAAGAVVAVAAAAAATALTRPPDEPAAHDPHEDPGMLHVHGLGVNPADGHIAVATHFGLWRVSFDGDAERVGDHLHDLMGFTVVGPDHFVASGHPDLRTDLPPLLGLLESRDAGQTWESASLLGEADFHALVAAHNRLYGWNTANGAVMVSDHGEAWDVLGQLPLIDLAVDPGDPDHLVASTHDGLARSDDSGATWAPAPDPGAFVGWLAWRRPEALLGISTDHRLLRSADGGETWEAKGSLPGPVEAFVDDPDALLAFVTDQGLFASRDDGATWDLIYQL